MRDRLKRKPVSRIDSNNTHGWFARVYRGEWVGSRSFADRAYGSKEASASVAWQWVSFADERLPVIPEKPVLKKATIHVRDDPQRLGMRYYDVYLPPAEHDASWSRKLYFKDLDEQKKRREQAHRIAEDRNRELLAIYANELRAWYLEHDRIMEQILRMWPEVKAAKLGFESKKSELTET